MRARGQTPAGTHIPIMVAEVIEALRPAPGECVADVTLGYGGHALELLNRIAHDGRLIGLDLDGRQLESTRERLSQSVEPSRFQLHHSHFAGLPKLLSRAGWAGVDVLFADLGVSSMQIDDPERGFSYKHDGPLDMRMDARRPRTAADILRTIDLNELAVALEELADEPEAMRIADAIVRHRGERPIVRTRELVDVILSAINVTRESMRTPAWRNRLHPAARTFQTLRILVNEELQGLEQLLRVAADCLRPGGRFGILTFHSGEDRRVKRAFRDGIREGVYSTIAEEPIRAAPQERFNNPRSTSAKFRWAVRSM